VLLSAAAFSALWFLFCAAGRGEARGFQPNRRRDEGIHFLGWDMSVFILKMIALASMFIDHIGAVFPGTPQWFRYVGRIAFPIFVFFIAEGAKRTHDIRKYLLRLFIFALLSQIPYALAFHSGGVISWGTLAGVSFITETNVFYTLFLGAAAIFAIQAVRLMDVTFAGSFPGIGRVVMDMAIIAAFASLAALLDTDYGAAGVLLIAFVYLCDKKWKRLLVLFAGVLYLYTPLKSCAVTLFDAFTLGGVRFNSDGLEYIKYMLKYTLVESFMSYYVWYFAAGCIPIALLLFYNSKRGPRLRWLFYAAYPLHLTILALIAAFYVR
jgi:hypothetical protein